MTNLSCRNYPTQKGLCLCVFTHKLTKINSPLTEDAHKNKPCLLNPSLLDEIPISPISLFVQRVFEPFCALQSGPLPLSCLEQCIFGQKGSDCECTTALPSASYKGNEVAPTRRNVLCTQCKRFIMTDELLKEATHNISPLNVLVVR